MREDPSPDNIDLLYRTVNESAAELARQYALEAIKILALSGNLTAIDAIFHVAVIHDNFYAQQIIRQYHLQPTDKKLLSVFWFLEGEQNNYLQIDPDLYLLTTFYFEQPGEVRLRLRESAKLNQENHWLEIIFGIEESTPQSLRPIVEHYREYSSQEQNLLKRLLKEKLPSAQPHYAELICELVIRYDDQDLRQWAIHHGIRPKDKIQAALFLFITEQWEEYEKFDISFTLINAAYHQAPSYIRKRILTLSRRSGYTDWIKESVPQLTRLRSITDLTDADWLLVYERLHEKTAYEDIWKLAQVAPPVWSAYFLSRLSVEWHPNSQDEYHFYQQITSLAEKCHANKIIKPDSTSIDVNPEIRCLAISPQDTFVAWGDIEGEVKFRLMASGLPFATHIKTPGLQIRTLAISSNNEYLSFASQDHLIRIFRISDGKLLKTCSGHRGNIRSLVFDADSRTLFSASFDGSIIAWRFPSGSQKWQITPNQGELFGLCRTMNGQWLLTSSASSQLLLLDSTNGKTIRELEAPSSIVTLFSASEAGNLAVGITGDKQILVWNLHNGKTINQFNIANTQLTNIILHPSENYILGASLDGLIHIWSLSNGSLLHQWQAHSETILDMKINQDGNWLVSASKNDLELCKLNLILLTLQPTNHHSPKILSQITSLKENRNLQESEKTWLDFIYRMIQWNQRYDIEIEEKTTIEIGEFDIEL